MLYSQLHVSFGTPAAMKAFSDHAMKQSSMPSQTIQVPSRPFPCNRATMLLPMGVPDLVAMSVTTPATDDMESKVIPFTDDDAVFIFDGGASYQIVAVMKQVRKTLYSVFFEQSASWGGAAKLKCVGVGDLCHRYGVNGRLTSSSPARARRRAGPRAPRPLPPPLETRPQTTRTTASS